MRVEKPPRTEIWLRKIYAPFAEDRSLTAIFRPGRRLLEENHPKALGVGENVRIRIIDKVGADWADLYGALLSQPNIPVLITDVTVMPLGEIGSADFEGSTPDVIDMTGLKIQLALIYNLSREELAEDCWITRTNFRYL